MAQKKFTQLFAKDFTGIDGESTPLEPDSGGFNRLLNYESAVGNSVRGRVGCQVAGHPGGFFGNFTHSYTRTQNQYDLVYQVPAGTYPNQTGSATTSVTTADGASINRLVALSPQLWVLDTFNYVVTRVSGSYPFTWYTTVNGSNINFVIKANGVSILDTSLNNGITSYTTVYSLLGTIDALAELSISRGTRGVCPPFAIVNGNQTSSAGAAVAYGQQYSITVNNTPHTFQVGDIISFPSIPAMTAGFVTAVTATSITYVGEQVTLLNGDILGYMGQSATCFPIDVVATAASGNLTISMPYYRCILEGDKPVGFFQRNAYDIWGNRTTISFYSPPTATSTAGDLFLTASATQTQNTPGWTSKLVKTDGVTVVNAGLPAPTAAVSVVAAAGALTGTYKYKAFLRRVDAQGNIVDGPLSDVVSVTPAANYNQITISGNLYTNQTGFQGRSAYKRTAEAPAAGQFFYVDDNVPGPAFLLPGDPICLTDNVAQKNGLWHFAFGVDALGTLHRTVCTDYCPLLATISPTASSIRVADSSGYTIPDNSEISTGLTVVTLRTAAGGNTYYVLCEVPYTGYANLVYFDNVTDAVLTAGEQFTEPVLGKEHDAPGRCSLVCQHQGGLVVARGPLTPNKVEFSTADGIEYFPTASNSFDIPSTQSGYITAIASDTNDRLAVFKERAYYDIAGDLDGGSFSVNVKTEGDFGITSQASLVRVQEVLLGLSRNGFILVSDGTLEWKAYKELNAKLVNQNYYFNWATAVNDSFARCYICTIPVPSAEPVAFVIDYSKERNQTFDRSWPTRIDSAGGATMVGDTLYHLSITSPYTIFRRLRRFDGNSPGSGNGDSFIDNTNAISYIMESNPITNNQPDVLNTPIRARVWSIPNDYVREGWVPFSALFEGGTTPFVTFVGGSNPNATNSTITFAADTDLYKDIKLVSTKTAFYIFRLTTNTIRTSPFISGVEILYAESYQPEDLIK